MALRTLRHLSSASRAVAHATCCPRSTSSPPSARYRYSLHVMAHEAQHVAASASGYYIPVGRGRGRGKEGRREGGKEGRRGGERGRGREGGRERDLGIAALSAAQAAQRRVVEPLPVQRLAVLLLRAPYKHASVLHQCCSTRVARYTLSQYWTYRRPISSTIRYRSTSSSAKKRCRWPGRPPLLLGPAPPRRQRERLKQRETHTKTERGGEKQRERHKQREREKQRDTQSEGERETEREKQTERQRQRQRQRQTPTPTPTQTWSACW
eukprot:3751838-Rhodomonas_salina.1